MKKILSLSLMLVLSLSVVTSLSFSASKNSKKKSVKKEVEEVNPVEKVRDSKSLVIAMSAAEKGDFTTVKYLFDSDEISINDKNEDGQTLLMKACCSTNLDLVKYLLELKADISVVDKFNYNALMYAIERSNMLVVQELFQSSIDIKNLTTDSSSLLILATKNKDFHVLKYLAETQNFDVVLKNNDGATLLMIAAGNGNFNVFKYLLNDKGISVIIRDDKNNTLLMYAVKGGNMDIVKHLVELTAVDIEETNNDNKTAGDIAIENNQIEIAKFLSVKNS